MAEHFKVGTSATSSDAPAIDWYTEMRDCVGEAAVLAGRIEHSDSDVGEALNRLCNVVAHLLDENKALSERVSLRRPACCPVGMGSRAREEDGNGEIRRQSTLCLG